MKYLLLFLFASSALLSQTLDEKYKEAAEKHKQELRQESFEVVGDTVFIKKKDKVTKKYLVPMDNLKIAKLSRKRFFAVGRESDIRKLGNVTKVPNGFIIQE